MKAHGALAVALAGIAALAAADPPAPPTVRRGLSPAEVRERLGPPGRVARLALFRRHVEQWVYDGPTPLRVEFSCRRGQEAVVTAVFPAPSRRP